MVQRVVLRDLNNEIIQVLDVEVTHEVQELVNDYGYYTQFDDSIIMTVEEVD